ncbi:hypothetical protein BT96DRAFT_1058755 [Gymnopus androsaceus JB14]|uniref:Uncharacterized protein n=1 Tax=Gymnopus androsaceus JB14 TaxID=1447944 RepID=A0A6A4H1W4_9AGAR|nr:hypothetical protein BT96DRAFT_1058755 [Gymnopus androsaceus JB14]
MTLPASPKPGISQMTLAKSNIFSDKTGALTQNVMEFQKCSVHGAIYGEGVTEAQRGAATRDGNTDMLNSKELNEKLSSLKQQMLNAMEGSFKHRYLQPEKLTLVSPKLVQDLMDRQGAQRGISWRFPRAGAVSFGVRG